MKLTNAEINAIATKILRELNSVNATYLAQTVTKLKDKVLKDVDLVNSVLQDLSSVRVTFEVQPFPELNESFSSKSTDWAYKCAAEKMCKAKVKPVSFDQIKEDIIISLIGNDGDLATLIDSIKAKYL